MATSTAILNASNDVDLKARFVVVAASKKVANPRAWVEENMLNLANAVVADTQTVADVYAYADTVRKQRTAELQAELAGLEDPGKNLAAVTDEYLATAIDSLYVDPVAAVSSDSTDSTPAA